MLTKTTLDVLFWCGVLIVAIAIVGIAAMVVRRRVLGERTSEQEAFTLRDLRQLHHDGQLTDQEFERAKVVYITRELARVDDPDENQQTSQSSQFMGGSKSRNSNDLRFR